MPHAKRRMTPLYLLDEEKKKLDALAKEKGVSRQKILEEIIQSGVGLQESLNDKEPIHPERRKDPMRHSVKTSVLIGPSKAVKLSGFSMDISAKGLCLQTVHPFREGDEIKLIFRLPGKAQSISCDARVVWTSPESSRHKTETNFNVGLEFMNLSLEDMMSISNFIENAEFEVG